MPKVSVVMPVFNAQRFLRDAVNSIVNQSFRDFQFIVVDDGSTDESTNILLEYAEKDPRILYHRQPENRGLVAALNEGVRLSDTQYIARMDADDISLPDRLSQQLEFLDNNDVDLVGANYIKFPGHRSKTTRLPLKQDDVARTMLYTCCIGHPVATMSRRAFEQCEGYDYRYASGGAEDYDFWLRISRSFKMANIKQPLLKYRLHNKSLTADAKKKDRYVHNSTSAVANHFANLIELDNICPQNTDTEISNSLLVAIEKTNNDWHQTCMKRWLIRLTRYCITDQAQRGEIRDRLFATASVQEKLKWRLYFRDVR